MMAERATIKRFFKGHNEALRAMAMCWENMKKNRYYFLKESDKFYKR
jgi:hypothetical protein